LLNNCMRLFCRRKWEWGTSWHSSLEIDRSRSLER